MWVLRALRRCNCCLFIDILPSRVHIQLLNLASLLSFFSHRFPERHLSFLLVFTLVISLGLLREVPRRRENSGHGMSEIAVKLGKLRILGRKKWDLLYPVIWFWFVFVFFNRRL